MAETPRTDTLTAAVHFRTIAHLYDPDDPTPEPARELSDRAEEQIFKGIIDAPEESSSPIHTRLEIVLPATDLGGDRRTSIVSAIRAHFRDRADAVDRDSRLTVRVGLREIRLTVGVCIPSFIGIAAAEAWFPSDPVAALIKNVLIIFCWVTIWQPFQSLVFDRWTRSRTAGIYRKIAAMDITVRPA